MVRLYDRANMQNGVKFMYDIYTLVNDFVNEGVRLLIIVAAMGLGIFVGKKLRDRKDSKVSENKEQ